MNPNSFNMRLRLLDNVNEVCPPVKLNEVKQESCRKAYCSNISMLPWCCLLFNPTTPGTYLVPSCARASSHGLLPGIGWARGWSWGWGRTGWRWSWRPLFLSEIHFRRRSRTSLSQISCSVQFSPNFPALEESLVNQAENIVNSLLNGGCIYV